MGDVWTPAMFYHGSAVLPAFHVARLKAAPYVRHTEHDVRAIRNT